MDQLRKIVIIPVDLHKEIENFRFEERKESFAGAMRDLARLGLETYRDRRIAAQSRASGYESNR